MRPASGGTTTNCFVQARGNLVLQVPRILNPCDARFDTIEAAQSACLLLKACGGVTLDRGVNCGTGPKKFNLRSAETLDTGFSGDSWIKGERVGGNCQRLPPPLPPPPPPSALRVTPLAADEAAAARSWSFCAGSCCAAGARNRSCVFGNLLFHPPKAWKAAMQRDLKAADLREPVQPFSFVLEPGATPPPRDDISTYLHNRFGEGGVLTWGWWSRFAPKVVSDSEVASVSKVIEQPILFSGDLHANVGHNYLDMLFPAFAALRRVHGAAESVVRPRHRPVETIVSSGSPPHDGESGRRWAAEAVLRTVPYLSRAAEKNVTFLIADTWRGADPRHTITWHQGTEQRETAAGLFGQLADMMELVRACPDGCLLRTIVAGQGHIGLCTVNERHEIGGAREHRSLWHFRQRIFATYKQQLPPLLPAGSRRRVGFVHNKRKFENLEELGQLVGRQHPELDIVMIRWEHMTFVEKLTTLRDMSVQVSGVGTAQGNSFLLPVGAVHVCLGWRHDESKIRIKYFDSMTLTSLDHVRVLYRTFYDPWELAPPRPPKETGATGANVRLNLSRTASLIDEALRIQAAGFETPLKEYSNSNPYDYAYEAMAKISNGLTHRERTADTGDGPRSGSNCWTANGVDDMLWGRLSDLCVFKRYKGEILRTFGY